MRVSNRILSRHDAATMDARTAHVGPTKLQSISSDGVVANNVFECGHSGGHRCKP